MCDLKNQIFALLKMCPHNAQHGCVLYYVNDVTTYSIRPLTDSDNYSIELKIYANCGIYTKIIDVTEKEYMELKWAIEEWNLTLENKVFSEFKEFTENEPNSMDDLLND